MFAYCGNNPVIYLDSTGEFFDSFLEKLHNRVYNLWDAFVSSIECEGGLGYGIGVELDNVGGGVYQDFYVGIDDGTTVTGNTASFEVSLSTVSIGDTYMHPSHTGNNVHVCKYCFPEMSIEGIVACPHSEEEASCSIGFLSINNKNDVLIGMSSSFHCVLGGHGSLYFNISEYFRRLFDYE